MFVFVTLRIVSSISVLFCQHIIKECLNFIIIIIIIIIISFLSGLPGFHRVGTTDQALLIHYSTKRF